MSSQGHCDCWYGDGQSGRLHTFSDWDRTADCCCRESLSRNKTANFGGSTLGACGIHCDAVGDSGFSLCVEIKKVLPGRHLVVVEADPADCLTVGRSRKRLYLDAYEYGRVQFDVTNDGQCGNRREEIECTVRWTGSPTDDVDPDTLPGVNWTLKPLVHH